MNTETTSSTSDATDVMQPPPLQTHPAVVVRNLSKRYGPVRAVDDLALDVPAGSIVGLVGPNGAGKTTTMLSVVTLLVPDRGSVEVMGRDALADPRSVREVVGYMPDFFGIYDGMTSAQYLDYFGAAYGLEPPRRSQHAADLLELVGLDHKADVDVAGLSRGMQQRLSLARALVHEPRVLVLDEPASGLDPRARVDLREILIALGEMGHTIIVSSHILSELEEMCDRVAIIEAGKVLAAGTPDEIRAGVAAMATVRVRLLVTDVDAQEEAVATAIAAAAGVGAVHSATRDAVVRFEVPGGDEAVARLLEALVGAGLRMTDFREEAGGLERLFMSVTQGVVR